MLARLSPEAQRFWRERIERAPASSNQSDHAAHAAAGAPLPAAREPRVSGYGKRRGPKLSPAERRQRRRDADARTELALFDKVRGAVDAAGGDSGAVRGVPLRVWRMALAIVGDPSGRAARHFMAKCTNLAAVGAVLRALVDDGQTTADLRGRRLVAAGLALHALSQRSRRRGRWQGVVLGIPRGAFAALLRDPYQSDHERGTPHVNTCFGERSSSDRGYFRVLAESGLFYAQQMPAHLAERCELFGSSGHATNRYWVVGDVAELVDDDKARYQVIALEDSARAKKHEWLRAMHGDPDDPGDG